MSDPLYVRYGSKQWEPFVQTKDNFHRQEMLLEFINLNKNKHTFEQFPHAKGGTLNATLEKTTDGVYKMEINNIITDYMYGKPEYFGFINRVTEVPE